MTRSLSCRIVDGIIRHHRVYAVVAGICCLLIASGAFRIRFENSVESFLRADDPAVVQYHQFRSEFGDDQLMVLVLPSPGEVFEPEMLTAIEALAEEIEALPLVRKARSITNAQDIVGSDSGFEVLPFIDKIPDEQQALAELRDTALANPLYQIDLISLDGTIASVIIEARISEKDDRYKQIREAVETILSHSPFAKRYYFAGDPIVEQQMTSDMLDDLFLFIPLTYFCLALLLLLVFKDLQGVAAPLIVISLAMGFLQGFIGYWNIPMNAVTSGLPSLVLCIATLDCVHIMAAYRRSLAERGSRIEAVRTSLQDNLFPCLCTSVTTAVGFLSVSLSELVPIRQFGLLAALSTLVIYPITFLVLPGLLLTIAPNAKKLPRREAWRAAGMLQTVARLSRFRGGVAFVLLVVLVLSALAIPRIQVETNHLEFLRKGNPVREATQFIQNKLGGVTPLEILVRGERNTVKQPAVLSKIEELQQYLASLPQVDKTVSPVQFIKEMHQAMNSEDPQFYFIPDSNDLIAQYILTYSFSGRDNDLDDFVDYEYQVARIRVRLQQMSSAELDSLLEEIEAQVTELFPPPLSVTITSNAVIQTRMIDILVEGQLLGLAVGIPLMMILIGLIHRSVLIGLFSFIPNALPLLIAAGIMGGFGISLNAGTAMASCIAFGLVVDDTLFFLHYARKYLGEYSDPEEAMAQVLQAVGVPVLYTSLILSAGFLILIFGNSYAIVYFGIVCAVAIVVALLADLFVLPLLILTIAPFRRALTAGTR